jgi:hypothetical protein
MQARKDRRPQGLGVFNVLDDELLCGILNQLAPRTLGTLACVSSVFYILCNEEPLWMQLCLHQHQGGVLQFQNSWRHSTLLKMGFVKKGTTMFKPPMHFDGFSSLFLYRRWYRCHVVLDSFAMDQGVIDRREHLSLKDFQAFYDGKKPVRFLCLLLIFTLNEFMLRCVFSISQDFCSHGPSSSSSSSSSCPQHVVID